MKGGNGRSLRHGWEGRERAPRRHSVESLEGIGPGSHPSQRLCLKTWKILLLLMGSHTYWLQLQPLLENKKKWRHWEQVWGYFVECEAYFMTVILVFQDVMVTLVLWSVGCVDEGTIALHQRVSSWIGNLEMSSLWKMLLKGISEVPWSLALEELSENPFMVLLVIYVQIKKNRFFTHK